MVYKRRELVDPKALLRAVQEVSEIAEEDEIAVALVGGFAMQIYGSNRFTKDIDVITDFTEPLDLPSEGPLTFGGEQVRAPNLANGVGQAVTRMGTVRTRAPWSTARWR